MIPLIQILPASSTPLDPTLPVDCPFHAPGQPASCFEVQIAIDSPFLLTMFPTINSFSKRSYSSNGGTVILEFDENLTSSSRLAIVASLVPGNPLTFMELRRATGIADGNLHVQTRKLAAAGYIDIIRVMRGRRSLTRFRLTELGLESLKLHIRKLKAIVAMESGEIRPQPGSTRRDDSQVWV